MYWEENIYIYMTIRNMNRNAHNIGTAEKFFFLQIFKKTYEENSFVTNASNNLHETDAHGRTFI